MQNKLSMADLIRQTEKKISDNPQVQAKKELQNSKFVP